MSLREARRALELEVDHTLDDDDFVHALAERAHGGGDRDDGRAPYQIALTVCPACDRATRDGAGVEFEVDAAVVEMAQCDAQHIGSTHVGNERASQTIPPRARRQVLRRDHGRCQVPGCRAAKYIDIHHIVPRTEGGGHDPELLICLCSGHHRALHAGVLRITGTAPDKLELFHADGTTYGAAANVRRPAPRVAPLADQIKVETPRATSRVSRVPTTVPRPAHRVAPPSGQVRVDALSALRNLGLRARGAEVLVRDAAGVTVEDLVRDALRSYASGCREPAVAYGFAVRS